MNNEINLRSLEPHPLQAQTNRRPSTGRLTSAVQERRIELRGKLTSLMANCCIARLVVLAAEDMQEPIVVCIDSSGGSAAAALNIISTIQGIRCPVLTFCRGQAIGPAALVAAHGLRGCRAGVENAQFSFAGWSFSEYQKGRFEVVLPVLTDLLARSTCQNENEVLQWLRDGAVFSTSDAARLGIVDALSSAPKYPSNCGVNYRLGRRRLEIRDFGAQVISQEGKVRS